MSLPRPTDSTFVLVTGAASGIGAELARGLSERGYGLLLVDRQGEQLEAVAEALRSQRTSKIETHVCDLTVNARRNELIKAVRERAAAS